MKTQLKVALIVGMITVFTVGGIVAYQAKVPSQTDLVLTELIDLPYEILNVLEVEPKERYDVYLIGNLDHTHEVLLSTKIQKEISTYYRAKNAMINLYVYGQTPASTHQVDFNDGDFLYTLQTTGSTIMKYEPLAFEGIEGNLMSSSQWEIKDSLYSKDQVLTFTTRLQETLSNEAIFSIVKGSSEEMSRHNGNCRVQQQIPISEETLFYHDSNYPNHLIQQHVLVGRTPILEGSEE